MSSCPPRVSVARMVSACLVVAACCSPVAAIPAFPGAEGFGAGATGGRGGEVYHVTNLNDSGPGSLRDAVSVGNRTVVFDVGGYIDLQSKLGITVDNITVAGQTAPGGGIALRGEQFSVGGDNIIVRGMRFRHGRYPPNATHDSVGINENAENVIFDHCSVQFGRDENFSIAGTNVTVQWTIIAWGLETHSAGSLLTANNTTIHHTLWAHNHTRNPKARGEGLDWVNNVVYDWDIPFIAGDTENLQHYANVRDSYFIAGPGKPTDKAIVKGRLNTSGVPTFNLYLENNRLDGNANGVLDGTDVGRDIADGYYTWLDEPLDVAPVTVDDPLVAFNRIAEGVGAMSPQRDEVDTILISDLVNQQGKIIAHQDELGLGNSGFGTLAGGAPPVDTDRDGMPDAWELANALDPNDPADRNGDLDGDGYTNLEHYVNSLINYPPIPEPSMVGILGLAGAAGLLRRQPQR